MYHSLYPPYTIHLYTIPIHLYIPVYRYIPVYLYIPVYMYIPVYLYTCTLSLYTCTLYTCIPVYHTCTPVYHTCTPVYHTCTPVYHTCISVHMYSLHTCTPVSIYRTCVTNTYYIIPVLHILLLVLPVNHLYITCLPDACPIDYTHLPVVVCYLCIYQVFALSGGMFHPPHSCQTCFPWLEPLFSQPLPVSVLDRER